SYIAENVAVRCKYVWAKESGKWKPALSKQTSSIVIEIQKDDAQAKRQSMLPSQRQSKLVESGQATPARTESPPGDTKSKHMSMTSQRQSRLILDAGALKSPLLRDAEAPTEMQN